MAALPIEAERRSRDAGGVGQAPERREVSLCLLLGNRRSGPHEVKVPSLRREGFQHGWRAGGGLRFLPGSRRISAPIASHLPCLSRQGRPNRQGAVGDMRPLSGHRASNRDPTALHQMQRSRRVHHKQESVGRGKGGERGSTVAVGPRLNVDALARSEMAREKARIARRRPTPSSPLEQAAEGWNWQEDQRERLRFDSGPEASVVSALRTRLPAMPQTSPADEGIRWPARRLGDEVSSKPVAVNAATLGRIAQHLKAREWARAMGKRQGTPLGSGLEKWAEAWRRNKELEERRLAGPPAAQDRRRPA